MNRSTGLLWLLPLLLLVESSCSAPSQRRSVEFPRKDGPPVQCFEPPPDVIAKGVRANADLAAVKVSNLLKGTGGVEVDIERIRQELPADVSAFEVVEFRICVQYGNGVLSKEEYHAFTTQIIPAIKKSTADQKSSQLGVEGVNDPFSFVSQKNQPFPPKVTKYARIKVLNIGGTRVTNVGVVVIKANGRQEGRFRLAVSSVDNFFERPNPPAPQVTVDLNPGEDAYFDAVIECNGKTCHNGKLAIPYIDNGQRWVISPVEQGVERLEDFTVRASGDMASSVTTTFTVSSTEGYLSLQAREATPGTSQSSSATRRITEDQ